MKKIIVWLITLMFFVAFAFTSIKLNAEELNTEEETPTIEEVENQEPVVDNTQEEVDKAPTDVEITTTIIENKTKEITDYVISLVVAFLGSSAFYAIVKAITSHGVKVLKSKIEELEKQNEISKTAKEIYESKIKDLEDTLVDATEKIDVVLEQFTKYLELDAEKQKQAAELLERLLPPLKEEETKEGGN